MAYRIQYNQISAIRYSQQNRRKLKWGTWILMMCIGLAVLWMRVNGVPDFLIPGDPNVTRAAADVMMEQIHAGRSMNEAVTVFCKEVLNGAGFESIL